MNKVKFFNVTLIDGLGGEPIKNVNVLTDGQKISSIDFDNYCNTTDDYLVIDATGKFMIPGLIDVHMHVTSMPAYLDAYGHLDQNLKAISKLRKCLQAGTTTVANVGGSAENVYLKKAIDRGDITGCASLVVGMMVNATGGHVRGRSADGPWEVRKAVREAIMAGADFIKTAASGGFMWEDREISWEDYTYEELVALVCEAHTKDKKVAVHAHTQPGLNNSIKSACDIITHGALIDDEALEGILKKDLYFIPTLFITSDKTLERPNLPLFMKQRMQLAHPVHREGVKKAHKMGIKIGAGTDGGPGDILIELKELTKCGLSPMEAIVAGTRNSADSLGILKTVGTVEAGKYADLVILSKDPTEDIDLLCTENIEMVIKRGQIYRLNEKIKSL